MKVLLINNRFGADAVGGAERMTALLAQGLREAGHQVAVYCLGRHQHEYEDEGLKVFQTKSEFINLHKRPSWWRLFYQVWLFRPGGQAAVKKIIGKFQPDFIWSHNLAGFGWSITNNFKNKIWLHTLHDVQLIHPSGQISVGQKKIYWPQKIYIFLARKFFNQPNLIVSPSRWLLEFHQSFGFFNQTKNIISPNPLGLSVGSRSLERKSYCFWAGQLYAGKGLKWLVRLWLKDKTLPPLYLAGRGQLARWLEQEIKADTRLKYLGALSAEQIYAHLEEARGLVFTSSILENWPTIIAEALYFKCPVVAARTGGVPEMIREGHNGFLFEVGNEADFKHALKSVTALAPDTAMEKISITPENYLKKVFGELN